MVQGSGRGDPRDIDGVVWGAPSSLRWRGFAMAASFWALIVALLGARVVCFDEIASARVAAFVETQWATLASLLAG